MRTSLVLLLFVAFNCRAGASKQPITFRYVKTGEFNNKGYISYGTVFWATNHTTNRFSLHLSAIENRVGTNWIVQSRQLEPLAFQGPGEPLAQYYLDPHSAGYAMVQLSSAPIGTTWRVKAIIRPVLTGLPATAARIRRYPELLKRRIQTGDTNIPVNPLATNITFYGKSAEVLSQEVSDE